MAFVRSKHNQMKAERWSPLPVSEIWFILLARKFHKSRIVSHWHSRFKRSWASCLLTFSMLYTYSIVAWLRWRVLGKIGNRYLLQINGDKEAEGDFMVVVILVSIWYTDKTTPRISDLSKIKKIKKDSLYWALIYVYVSVWIELSAS